MKVNYADLIESRPDLLDFAKAASETLEARSGPSAPQIRASWDVGQDDQGRDLVGLEISDWTGSVGYRFSPEELANPIHMKSRLDRLWGDLLMVQSHAQLDGLDWQLRLAGER